MPAGRPRKYDPDFHPTELVRLAREEGLFMSQICRRWGIGRKTLYDWATYDEKFSRAIKKAHDLKEGWWFDKLQENLENKGKFDSVAWSMAMRHHGISTDQRMLKMPELEHCKSYGEKADAIIKAQAQGKLSAKESKDLMDTIAAQAKINENTEMKQMLEEIQNAQKQK